MLIDYLRSDLERNKNYKTNSPVARSSRRQPPTPTSEVDFENLITCGKSLSTLCR